MPNYKIVVSKDNKKYSLALKAENELVARDRVHKEWYSILTLQEISENENIWSAFIFEWYKNWELKHWKIAWNDIFKAYIKLKNLGYNVDYLYFESDENVISLEQKRKIIEELEEEYTLYNSKIKGKQEVKVETNEEKWREKLDLSSFYMNKELEETNKLIDLVLAKLEKSFFWENSQNVPSEKKEKLKQIYNEIIKLKKSTNISKLREVWELALKKIWELELLALEKNRTEANKELLKETNKLLKKLWAKDQIVEKEKSVSFKINSLWEYIKGILGSKNEKEEKIEVDKESYSYIKNSLYLNKYKQKYSENTKFIFKNFFKLLGDRDLREKTYLLRNVIKQNIVLLKAREKWVSVPYTLLKKWIQKIFESILSFFKAFLNPLFWIIFVYSASFIIYFNLYSVFDLAYFNFTWLSIVLVIILSYIWIFFSKNVLILILNFVILSFIVIFGIINF